MSNANSGEEEEWAQMEEWAESDLEEEEEEGDMGEGDEDSFLPVYYEDGNESNDLELGKADALSQFPTPTASASNLSQNDPSRPRLHTKSKTRIVLPASINSSADQSFGLLQYSPTQENDGQGHVVLAGELHDPNDPLSSPLFTDESTDSSLLTTSSAASHLSALFGQTDLSFASPQGGSLSLRGSIFNAYYVGAHMGNVHEGMKRFAGALRAKTAALSNTDSIAFCEGIVSEFKRTDKRAEMPKGKRLVEYVEWRISAFQGAEDKLNKQKNIAFADLSSAIADLRSSSALAQDPKLLNFCKVIGDAVIATHHFQDRFNKATLEVAQINTASAHLESVKLEEHIDSLDADRIAQKMFNEFLAEQLDSKNTEMENQTAKYEKDRAENDKRFELLQKTMADDRAASEQRFLELLSVLEKEKTIRTHHENHANNLFNVQINASQENASLTSELVNVKERLVNVTKSLTDVQNKLTDVEEELVTTKKEGKEAIAKESAKTAAWVKQARKVFRELMQPGKFSLENLQKGPIVWGTLCIRDVLNGVRDDLCEMAGHTLRTIKGKTYRSLWDFVVANVYNGDRQLAVKEIPQAAFQTLRHKKEGDPEYKYKKIMENNTEYKVFWHLVFGKQSLIRFDGNTLAHNLSNITEPELLQMVHLVATFSERNTLKSICVAFNAKKPIAVRVKADAAYYEAQRRRLKEKNIPGQLGSEAGRLVLIR